MEVISGFLRQIILRKGGKTMIPLIEPVLYMDLQAAKPVWFCENCGAECYHPARLCTECEEMP